MSMRLSTFSILVVVMAVSVDDLATQARPTRYTAYRTGVPFDSVSDRAFNNRGDILFMSRTGAAGSTWSFQGGLQALPTGIVWHDMNNSGEVVGRLSGSIGSFRYSIVTQAGGEIRVGNAPTEGAEQINDAGDVVVYSNGWKYVSGTSVVPLPPLPADTIGLAQYRLGNDRWLLAGVQRAGVTQPTMMLIHPTGAIALPSSVTHGFDFLPGTSRALVRNWHPSGSYSIMDEHGSAVHYPSSGWEPVTGDCISASGVIVSSPGGLLGVLDFSPTLRVQTERLIDAPGFVMVSARQINDSHQILGEGTFGPGAPREYVILQPGPATAVMQVSGSTVRRNATATGCEYGLRWGQVGQFQVAGGEPSGLGAIAIVDGNGGIISAVVGGLDAAGSWTVPIAVPHGLSGLILLKGFVLDSQLGVLDSVPLPIRATP